MGHVFRSIQQSLHKIDPLDRAVSSAAGLNFKNIPVAPAPQAPGLDAATQAVLDAQDQRSRRKGVLANVFAGSTAAATTPTVQKATLGG